MFIMHCIYIFIWYNEIKNELNRAKNEPVVRYCAISLARSSFFSASVGDNLSTWWLRKVLMAESSDLPLTLQVFSSQWPVGGGGAVQGRRKVDSRKRKKIMMSYNLKKILFSSKLIVLV